MPAAGRRKRMWRCTDGLGDGSAGNFRDIRRVGGPLPTIEEFARSIIEAIDADVPSGYTFYIGGEDYQQVDGTVSEGG